jgi:hypothetical protein
MHDRHEVIERGTVLAEVEDCEGQTSDVLLLQLNLVVAPDLQA